MRRILVVDDVATDPDALISILHHGGYRLVSAENGSNALAVARVERADLVISDLLLPVAAGGGLATRLRQPPDRRRLPIVSNMPRSGAREARPIAMSTEAAALLAPPVESNEVSAVVEGALLAPTTLVATTAVPPGPTEPGREDLRSLAAKVSDMGRGLSAANARLRALINIGVDLASERDSARLLHNVAVAARELFGATYVTLGVVDRHDSTLERIVVHGVEARPWIAVGDTVPGMLRTVLTGRGALRGDNPTGNPGSLGLSAGHPPIRAYLAAPVASPTHVYGWLCLVRDEAPFFNEDDEAILTAISGQVGRIYENEYCHAVAMSERDRAPRPVDPGGVILLGLDTDARIALINQYACTLLGWTLEELSGCDFIETCVPARFRESVRAELAQLGTARDRVVTAPIVTRTGEERLIEWRTTVLRDAAGRPAGTLRSGADITGRTRAEAEARLQTAALTAAAQAIMITDVAGAIEWGTPAPARIARCATVDAAGRDPRDPVTSDQHDPAFDESMWQTILSGQAWRGEIVTRQENGALDAEEPPVPPGCGEGGATESCNAMKQDAPLSERHEDARGARARLSALFADVGLALSRAATLAEALTQCAEALVAHLGAASGRLWTLTEDYVLELRASAGLHTHLHGPLSRVPLGESTIGRIAHSRRPHLTNAVRGDPQVHDQAWARSEGMVAFAGHPLIVGDRVVGVMAICARHALSEPVLAALGSVADLIALGIERHRSAEALGSAEALMRCALENAQVGIWDIDYATGVVRWSEILERQCGLAPGTFGGAFEAFLAAVHAGDCARVRAVIDGAARAGSEFMLPDFRVVWPDQTVHWLSGAGRVVLGPGGEPRHGVGIVLDVSGRRQLEEQYHQSQKMEAVGQLAGGVAHDFNNLLTAILGYCELLLAEGDETDPQRRDILEIQKAGERAAGLTRQLLGFTRKQIREPTILDLNAVVSNLKSMLARLIGDDIDVRVGLDPRAGQVTADSGQIEQVLLNLAVNARDAMPRGGTLTIETANVDLDGSHSSQHSTPTCGPHVVLAVTDTGTGMTRDVQARLFEPFFTTKRVGKGTGLGLAIVHEIVTAAGGSLGVDSEIGTGTTLKVYLPRTDAASTPAPSRPAPLPARRDTQTVLVVEDAPQLLELTSRLLTRLGYRVLTAAAAEEAVWLFERNASIAVILTDVVMPGASGPELTRHLVERRPGLKVIYTSGCTEDVIIDHGVVNLDVAFLPKPFTSEALERALRDVLDR